MPRSLLAALAVLGAVLTATVVPGVFTVDEDNYLVTILALRAGRLTVPGTGGLPPSPELVWFDPTARSRVVDATPVSSTVPPLYAALAVPFSPFGWRGLVLLNTLGFLVTIVLVFRYCRRHAESEAAPWIAAAAFSLASFNLEYAQGLWPHMTSVALATGAVAAASHARHLVSLPVAALAGLLAGAATGIRYQNIALAGCVGFGLFLLARDRRWSLSMAYGSGLAVPLAVSSLLNRLRLGHWNPISKGGRYLAARSTAGEEVQPSRLAEALHMLYARVVDFSHRPSLAGTYDSYLQPDPETGAYLLGSAVKKALLQSAPWMLLPLALCLLVWLRRPAVGGSAATEVRALSLIVVPMLLLFAAFGTGRTDGFCFNQRYFLELVPLLAVILGWVVGYAGPRWRSWILGTAIGLLLAAAVLVRPPENPIRQVALLYLPLGLALVVGLSGWLALRRSHPGTVALTVAVALGWAGGVHLGDDLSMSRAQRSYHLQVARSLDPLVPHRSALFAWWGNKDPLGSLLFDRDLVVLDAWADDGESAPRLIDALGAQGRQVFLLANGFPRGVLDTVLAGRRVEGTRSGPLLLLEIAPVDPAPAAQ